MSNIYCQIYVTYPKYNTTKNNNPQLAVMLCTQTCYARPVYLAYKLHYIMWLIRDSSQNLKKKKKKKKNMDAQSNQSSAHNMYIILSINEVVSEDNPTKNIYLLW